MKQHVATAVGAVIAMAVLAACVGGGGPGGAELPTTSATTPATAPSTTTSTTTSTTAPSTTTVTPSTTTTTASTTTTPEPLAEPIERRGGDVPPALVELARFVEATRGHPFLRPVTVDLVPDADFEEMIVASFHGAALDALRDQYELLVLLGLLPEGIDYVDLVRISDRESIIGFYVPGSDTLHLRGDELTPFVSMVAVHELTHALDDQWFDLSSEVDGDGDGDRAFAAAALAEGSATWVEETWMASRTVEERVAIRRAGEELWLDAEHADWPISAIEIGEDVYSLGSSFVRAVFGDDEAAALDAAFTDPPESTEQLLHPERYRAGDAPMPVAVPVHAGAVVAEGTIGELFLVELLSAAVSPSTAREAAEGWGGDRYVITDDAATRCLVLEVRTDSDADEIELAGTAARWAARQPDATATRHDGSVRIESCHTIS